MNLKILSNSEMATFFFSSWAISLSVFYEISMKLFKFYILHWIFESIDFKLATWTNMFVFWDEAIGFFSDKSYFFIFNYGYLRWISAGWVICTMNSSKWFLFNNFESSSNKKSSRIQSIKIGKYFPYKKNKYVRRFGKARIANFLRTIIE